MRCSAYARRLKRGILGGIKVRIAFESIVERSQAFVARMPPVYSTTGSACCRESFSALGDQRAEILPVQRPPVLSAGGDAINANINVSIFSSQHLGSAPLHQGCLPKCPENFPGKLGEDTGI